MKIKSSTLSKMFQQGVTGEASPGRRLHKQVAGLVELQKPAVKAYQESRLVYRAGRTEAEEQQKTPLAQLLFNMGQRAKELERLASSRSKSEDLLMAAEKEMSLLQAAVARADEMSIVQLAEVNKAQKAALAIIQQHKARPVKTEPKELKRTADEKKLSDAELKLKRAELYPGRNAVLLSDALNSVRASRYGAINRKDVPERGVQHLRVPRSIEQAFDAQPQAPSQSLPTHTLTPVKKNLPPVDKQLTQQAKGLGFLGGTIEVVHAPPGLAAALAHARKLSEAFVKVKQATIVARGEFEAIAKEMSDLEDIREGISDKTMEHLEESKGWNRRESKRVAHSNKQKRRKQAALAKYQQAIQRQQTLAEELEKATQKTLSGNYTVQLSGGKQVSIRSGELASMLALRRQQDAEKSRLQEWQQGIPAAKPATSIKSQVGDSPMGLRLSNRPKTFNEKAKLRIPKRVELPMRSVYSLQSFQAQKAAERKRHAELSVLSIAAGRAYDQGESAPVKRVGPRQGIFIKRPHSKKYITKKKG